MNARTGKTCFDPRVAEQWHHFFADVFKGEGDVTASSTFDSPDSLLERLSECDALIYGHFVHGRNHSNVLCDARRVFNDDLLRNEIVTNLARYILRNKIALIVSPNNSNVYLLIQALRGRFELAVEEGGDLRLQFATALWMQTTVQDSDYQLTAVATEPGTGSGADRAVLILDDGVCSGGTIKALIREIVSTFPSRNLSPLRIHVIAFVNRLSENNTAFWNSLSLLASAEFKFSYFMALPLPAYPRENCPVCRQLDDVDRLLHASAPNGYAGLFYRDWKSALAPVDLYTLPSAEMTQVLAGDPVRTLAAHFIALRRGNLRLVWQRIRDYEHQTVVITVLCHLLLRTYDMHARDPEPSQVIRELLRYGKTAKCTLKERLYILRKLIQFAALSTSPHSLITLAGDIVEAYTPALQDRSAIGGLGVLFSQMLSGGKSRQDQSGTTVAPDNSKQALLDTLEAAVQKNMDPTSRGHLSWLIHSVSAGQAELNSVGAAVLRLASHNRLTPHHHSQRITLQEVSGEIRQCLKRGDLPAKEKHRLEKLCRAVHGFFGEMYDCARILARQSSELDAVYQLLNESAEGLNYIEDELSALLQANDEQQVRSALSRLFDVVERLRVVWFASPHARIKQFVRPFAMTPAAVIREAASGYTGSATIDVDGLKGLEHTLALFPRDEFAEVVGHLHRHFDEKIIPGKTVSAAWHYEPHPFERAKLVLPLRNTGTQCTGSTVLRGLQRFQDGLRQFGGDLHLHTETGELNHGCAVKIELHIWE